MKDDISRIAVSNKFTSGEGEWTNMNKNGKNMKIIQILPVFNFSSSLYQKSRYYTVAIIHIYNCKNKWNRKWIELDLAQGEFYGLENVI